MMMRIFPWSPHKDIDFLRKQFPTSKYLMWRKILEGKKA
jgi:hypothetical protein